jgi:hypothetical protein
LRSSWPRPRLTSAWTLFSSIQICSFKLILSRLGAVWTPWTENEGVHAHTAKNSRQKCCESVRFIGRIRSSWKPRIGNGLWRSIRATSGSTEVLRTIFCSETSVWRAVEFAKTILVLRPPNAWESIAL